MAFIYFNNTDDCNAFNDSKKIMSKFNKIKFINLNVT